MRTLVKILLDESVPIQLASLFSASCEVSLATSGGWNGLKNGELIARAREEGIDALITVDQGMAYQQDVAQLAFPVFVIDAPRNRVDYLQPFIPEILRILESGAEPGVHSIVQP